MKKPNLSQLKQISWKRINAAFCRLSKRQRWLVIGLSLIIILALWYLIIDLPLSSELSELASQAQMLQSNILDSGKRANEIIRESGVADPEAQAQHKALQQSIQKLNEGLSLINNDDFFPERADMVMQALLKNESGLTLVGLSSLPTKVLQGFDDEGRLLYVHDITLIFKGNYFATLSYLQSLEKIKWYLFWDDLNYQVTDYPQAEIKLHVYALSTSRSPLRRNVEKKSN